jgi:hypothetical protein
MASKIYDFLVPSDFTYDTNKILVSGGIASLKEDLTNVYARWHLNEATGLTVLDSSGNGRNGTPVNSPISVAGKLNNCLSFNRTSQYIDCGNIANFERTQPFSIEIWFQTTYASTQVLISKYLSPAGWDIHMELKKLWFQLINSSTNKLQVWSDTIVATGTFHHLIITYNGSSMASGVKFYIDNILQNILINSNTLSASILNSSNLFLGKRTDGFYYSELLDEVIIYNKELSASEVSYRYNSGIGRENVYYSTDKPTIKPISSWQVSGLSAWFGYVESLGAGNEGSIGYQLSDDNGVNWRYWNGSAWAITTEVNYNSAAVVGAHISSFPITNEKILFRAFLISDGNQKVELDTIEITATVGFPPNVFAGADKSCKDHQTIKPFSDAVINDPDGNIENATAWRKIESGVYTQILKGGYGTLQDAIRNFEYTFDNLGAIDCILKITDEEGFSQEDTMVMTVSKYTITFNIKDTDGNHLGNVLSDFDDGVGWQIKNSPFTYQFEYKSGNYRCTFDKTGFISQSVDVPVSEHTENITLQRLTVDPSAIADAVWDELKTGHNSTNSFGKETQDIKIDTNSIVSTLSTLVISIWNYSTRTLTSFGTLIIDIWNYSIRTITSGGITAAEIWAYITRTLTLGTKDSEINAIKAKTDNLPVDPASETLVKRILGLSQENYRLSDVVYTNGLISSTTIKIYPTSVDCENNTNPLAIYNVTASYDLDGKLLNYKVKKQ